MLKFHNYFWSNLEKNLFLKTKFLCIFVYSICCYERAQLIFSYKLAHAPSNILTKNKENKKIILWDIASNVLLVLLKNLIYFSLQ